MVSLSVRSVLLASAAVFVVGVLLVALSVLDGGASVSLVLIIPVISGSSLSFLFGVALLIAGFVTLVFAASEGGITATAPPSAESSPASPNAGGAGGLILVGPVPIVFGSWRGISRRTCWWLALLGAVVLTVFVLAFVWLLR